MTEQKKNFLLGLTTGSSAAFFIALVAVSWAYYANISRVNAVQDKKDYVKEEAAKPTAPTGTAKQAAVVKADLSITKEDRVRGLKDAKITIFEFSDFQCPYCSRFHDTLSQAMKKYPNDIKWVFKNFPLDKIHPYARQASEAAECASDQDKYWEYNDGLFANQSSINPAFLSTLAKNLGLNTKDFDKCVADKKYAEKVENDLQTGLANGITGTPGWFINGQKVGGAISYDQLEQMIESLLK